ncbi:hypothetical protein [Streptomyces griseorubiginosus]|uniref:hypothetical protein n=1 Tax=Streptomyces griseorubiginosus TaxID=67304 RepID=UPI003661D20F
MSGQEAPVGAPRRGLKTEAYRRGRARADGVLVPKSSLKGQGEYRREEKLPFGATVTLPEPLGFALDTEPLKEFAD